MILEVFSNLNDGSRIRDSCHLAPNFQPDALQHPSRVPDELNLVGSTPNSKGLFFLSLSGRQKGSFVATCPRGQTSAKALRGSVDYRKGSSSAMDRN